MDMSSTPSPCDSLPLEAWQLAEWLTRERGIASYGVARAMPVEDAEVQRYRRWIAAGHHGAMDYLGRYDEVRSDPRLLLDGARSLVVCAFPYLPSTLRNPSLPHIAAYAYGADYHDVVRARLRDAARDIASKYGGEWRVCVDTAPLRERYWAVKAGVGFIGRNQQLIVPGVGSYVFIGTLVTTLEIGSSNPCTLSCGDCGACRRVCPGQALTADGGMDARRCLSYLTIEYRGELPAGTRLHNTLYGCDRCQQVCPHNREALTALLPDFEGAEALLGLTVADVMAMDADGFRAVFGRSAVRRAKLEGLQRTARRLMDEAIPDRIP